MSPGPTTNANDLREAAKLRQRLAENVNSLEQDEKIPERKVANVDIAEGAHKYVLIQASTSRHSAVEFFVTSKKNAPYHRDAAEPMVEKLERAGYKNIQVLGGGRIDFEPRAKQIAVFGFSYGFGQADHSISRDTIVCDSRYSDFEVTISNDGY